MTLRSRLRQQCTIQRQVTTPGEIEGYDDSIAWMTRPAIPCLMQPIRAAGASAGERVTPEQVITLSDYQLFFLPDADIVQTDRIVQVTGGSPSYEAIQENDEYIDGLNILTIQDWPTHRQVFARGAS